MESIISGQEDPEIKKIDNYFASMIKPKNFYGKNNYELSYNKSFEKNCIILSEYANKDVKRSTTKEYFALLEHHNKIIKSQRREKNKKKLT